MHLIRQYYEYVQVMEFLILVDVCLEYNALDSVFEKGRQIHCLKSSTGSLLSALPVCLFIFFSIAYSLALHARCIIQAGDRGLMLLSVSGEKALKHLDNMLIRATQCNSVFSWQGALSYQLDVG